MGAYDLLINAIQEGKISTLEDRIETLLKRVEILEDWIRYYGKCETGKPYQVTPMVETSTGLEASVLEERTSSTEEGHEGKK